MAYKFMASMKLQKACLNVIVGEFDKFMDLHDERLARYEKLFEFLQRAYSAKLIEMLTMKEKLKSDHLNFLLNVHLKELKLRSEVFEDATVLIKRLQTMGSSVTYMEFCDSYTQRKLIQITSLIPNVEVLDFSFCLSCSDVVLKNVGQKCQLVHTIRIPGCHITDEGLKHLCPKTGNGQFGNNVKLQHLELDGTCVSPKGVLFALNHFPMLEDLDYRHLPSILYSIKEKTDDVDQHSPVKKKRTLAHLPVYNLTKLDLQNLSGDWSHLHIGITDGNVDTLDISLENQPTRQYNFSFGSDGLHKNVFSDPHMVKDVIRACATLCPNVTSLCAQCVTQNMIDSCTHFSKLRRTSFIGFGGSSATPVDLSAFLKCRGNELTSLTLSNVSFSIALVAKYCSNLNDLYLESVNFEAENNSCRDIVVFHRLETLSLCSSSTVLSRSEIMNYTKIISSCTNLITLSFYFRSQLPDHIPDCLLHSKCIANLVELNFYYSNCCIDFIIQLISAATKLETLRVSERKVSKKQFLRILTAINELNLNREPKLILYSD